MVHVVSIEYVAHSIKRFICSVCSEVDDSFVDARVASGVESDLVKQFRTVD